MRIQKKIMQNCFYMLKLSLRQYMGGILRT